MLILPLHKPLNRQTLPWVTLLLILINCIVYFALQVPADSKARQAIAFYVSANLGEHEFPAFIAQIEPLERRQEYEAAGKLDEPWRSRLLVPELQADENFQRSIVAGKILGIDSAGYASYHQQRLQFDGLWQRANFTERFAHRTGTFNPMTMLTSTFMHGGFEHLLGNMLMLIIVGLLVEGALTKRWYLLTYLSAGFAASLASELWRYDTPITALGASGAIAGLMGALPVLWGLRRVRVFYWLGFYFNYLHVPALVLLPIWLGKEVFSMLTSQENIGFDAHAGGMIAGAALCWGFVKLGRVNESFFEETQPTSPQQSGVNSPRSTSPNSTARSSAAEQAQKLRDGIKALGELDFARAHSLLSSLAFYERRRLDILIPAYRAARFGPGGVAAEAAARRVLLAQDVELSEIKTLHSVWFEHGQAGLPLPLSYTEQLYIAELWLQGGFLQSAEPMLLALAKGVSEKRFDGAQLKPVLAQFAQALARLGDSRAARIQAFSERLG